MPASKKIRIYARLRGTNVVTTLEQPKKSPLRCPCLLFGSSPSFLPASRRALSWFFACLCALLLLPSGANAAAITAGTRYPTNEEQYTLQLINHARTSPDGLTILQTFVTNDISAIKASSTGTSGTGTKWSAGYWKSNIHGRGY